MAVGGHDMSEVFVCVCIFAERASWVGQWANEVYKRYWRRGLRTGEVGKLKKGG